MANWIKNQRRGRANQLSGTGKYKLNNERFQKLNDIGFDWDPLEKNWEEYFNALLSFKERELNVKVKYNHIENGLNLGGWLSAQKDQKSKGKLSSERIQKFEEIGIKWSITKKINRNKVSKEFEKKFNLLLKFREREGHCAVPYAHIEEDTKLGHWVNNQRSLKSNLGMEIINKFDQIGFVWSAKKKAS